MSHQYSLNLTIRGKEDGGLSGPDLLKAGSDVVRDWLTDRSSVDVDAPSGTWKSDTGCGEVITIEDDVIEDVALFALKWEHGDRDDAPFRWRTQVSLATEGSDVEAAVRVEVLDSDGNAPMELDRSSYPHPDRPRIVPMLIEQFDCYFGTEPLTSRTRHVSEGEAARFTWQTIMNPERSLPVVVVSMPRAGCQDIDPTLSSGRLAGRLAGLATVVVYDQEATWELGRMLGRRFSCFNGATRMYLPQWSPDDDTHKHELWLADPSLSESQTSQAIFDRCTEFVVQMPRYAGQRVIDNASARTREKRALESFRGLVEEEVIRTHVQPLVAKVGVLEGESETLRRDLESSKQSAKSAHEDRQLRLEYENENERLTTQARARVEQIKLLETDKENLVAELSEYRRGPRQHDTTGDHATDEREDEQSRSGREVRTVREAVDLANDQFLHLRFLRQAIDGALTSNYERPEEVYDAFRVLEDLAVKRSRGTIGTDVAVWLREQGIDFAAHESDMTMARWGAERRVTDEDGRVWSMEPHVKLGGGRGKNILRVHLEWDDESACWVIGHVVGHFTNTRS